MADRLIGRKLGQYTIKEHIGSGGMATVYKGYRADIDRTVAIKILTVNPAVVNESLIARFKLEAKTIARLEHPHILTLYDYGVEDDLLYLVVPYMDGGSLGDWLKSDEPPSLAHIAKLLSEVASALDYAHREGIIHRDIKPDNILLDKEGHALIADFGIVKITESDSSLTETGGVVGTPAYLAPEQAGGEGITSSSDIYSLGVVIYEIVTGKKPYSAETPIQVILKHINDPVPNIRELSPNLPDSLEGVMQRVLAKLPSERYATATAFSEDFTQSIQGQDVKTASVPLPPATISGDNQDTTRLQQSETAKLPDTRPDNTSTIQTNPRRNGQRRPLWLVGGAAMLVTAIIVGFIVTGRPANDTPAPTGISADATAAGNAASVVPTFGRVTFNSTNSFADTLELQVENLTPPGSGNTYEVWLHNTVEDTYTSAGTLSIDTFGSGNLSPYVDEEERVLLAHYNQVLIKREPAGEKVYAAMFTENITDTFNALFVTSMRGINEQSIVESAITEAETAERHAGLAQSAGTVGSMKSHAEHTINIIEGTQVDYNENGRPENPGFGVGVLPLLDEIENDINTLATAPNASTTLQSNIEFMRVCVLNARQDAERVVSLEQDLLAADNIDGIEAEAAEASRLAGEILNGVDLNGNGQIDPFEGECALKQIEQFSLLVGTADIVAAIDEDAT